MAKHMLVTNERGEPVKLFSSEAYPYCDFVQCRECKEYFCDNGCSPALGEECPTSDVRLFDIDAFGNIDGR